MKISKEIKVGIIALAAIGLLVSGINFLKGNSFFGGDDVYYAYFSNSGGIIPASSVVLNGVSIGKVLSVENMINQTPEKQVRITFNLQIRNLKITRGSTIEIGPLDLFNKGLVLELNPDDSRGYYRPGEGIMGSVAVDMFSQVKAYADPVSAGGGRKGAYVLDADGNLNTNATIDYSYLSYWDVPKNELDFNPSTSGVTVKNPN